MNLVDCCVTKVLGKRDVDVAQALGLSAGDPFYGKIYTVIDIECDSWGRVSQESLIFEKGSEPDVQVGYVLFREESYLGWDGKWYPKYKIQTVEEI